VVGAARTGGRGRWQASKPCLTESLEFDLGGGPEQGKGDQMSATGADMFRLDGKVALVTGGSGGIGKALGVGLGLAGARLALTGRSQEKLDANAAAARAAGCEDIETFGDFDLTHPGRPAALAETVAERMGGVDILVNVAGLNRRKPALEFAEEDWDAVMNPNLKAVFFLSREVARLWVEGGRDAESDGRGKIINIASLAGAIGIAEIAPYGASKLGVVALTRSLGVEWAQEAICVNAIAPGYHETPMTIAQGIFDNPKIGPWVRSRIPMGRLGTTEDLVGPAIYLASAASDYMTGQTVFVDGGFEAG